MYSRAAYPCRRDPGECRNMIGPSARPPAHLNPLPCRVSLTPIARMLFGFMRNPVFLGESIRSLWCTQNALRMAIYSPDNMSPSVKIGHFMPDGRATEMNAACRFAVVTRPALAHILISVRLRVRVCAHPHGVPNGLQLSHIETKTCWRITR